MLYIHMLIHIHTGICLVGKGIVYDSGGLSIKTPTAGMCGMKMVR